MSTPTVSIIMPFLGTDFLTEAVESVRKQTYTNWELLLCDDGAATDATALARSIAASDSRIRWLEHEQHQNLGASAARNLGLRYANGELIAFLDADDAWFPNKLEEQVAILAQRPEVDVLCGSTQLWYSWTGAPESVDRDRVLRIGVPHNSFWPAPTFLARRLRGAAASPATCSVIARRNAVDRSGGFEQSFRSVYTDQSFYVKLFLESSLLVVDTCWDRYRQHGASSVSSATRAGEMQQRYAHYLAWVRAYLDQRNVHDEPLRAALRLAEWRVRNRRLAALLRAVRHGYYGVMRTFKRLLLPKRASS